MFAQTKQTLILSLIRDDLINLRLVHGLNALGLQADAYMLHLGETVLRLMGYPNTPATDAVYTRYYELTQRACEVDISQSHAAMDALAGEIYAVLQKGK